MTTNKQRTFADINAKRKLLPKPIRELPTTSERQHAARVEMECHEIAWLARDSMLPELVAQRFRELLEREKDRAVKIALAKLEKKSKKERASGTAD